MSALFPAPYEVDHRDDGLPLSGVVNASIISTVVVWLPLLAWWIA